MTRRIEFGEWSSLTLDHKKRLRQVRCRPQCDCDTPKTGISIGKMDHFGDPYPEAVSVILDPSTKEWVVHVYADNGFGSREAARYPADQVEAIRHLPFETRLYSHFVLDD